MDDLEWHRDVFVRYEIVAALFLAAVAEAMQVAANFCIN
jgi:hypothetical protein